MDLVKRKMQQTDEEEEKPQKAKANFITMARDEVNEDIVRHCTRPHWARATAETPVKLGERKEILVALIDHGSEINLMSTEVYK